MSSVPLQIAFVADDFTGSTDALEQLALAGLRTALFTQVPTPAELAAFGPLDAIGVATSARSLAPAAMEAQLRPIFTALRALSPRHMHYKVCSTFDSSLTVGSIGRALDVGAEIFGGAFVPVVVGAPPLGRYCAFGHLFARFGIGSNGQIYRLDRHPAMSRHPVTPADEADLRIHLGRQTAKKIGLVNFLALDGTLAESETALSSQLALANTVVLFDTLTNAHLARIGALLERRVLPGSPMFSVGSSAVEMALNAEWARVGLFSHRPNRPTPAANGPLLVLSGSCSPVTAQQIAWAENHGFAVIALDVAATLRGDAGAFQDTVSAAVAALRAGRSTILCTSRGEPDARLANADRRALGQALGRLGGDVLARAPLGRLLIAGGDSSSYAAEALGLKALTFLAPLSPGSPLCRASAPGSPLHDREIAFKGGQVGTPDFFGRAAGHS